MLVAAPDPAPADLPLVQGERAIANDLVFEIETERACYRPGEEVRGTVAVTPTESVRPQGPGRRLVPAAIQESHPVEKTPGSPTEASPGRW